VSVERFVRAQLVEMPWKNGGGLTREIVCRPAGTGLDRFDWRVSVAEISASGSFSIFDGIDRVIMLLDGNGVELHSADGSITQRLSEPLAPFAFSGDVAIDASLIAGASSDFNIMTRRATTRSEVQILEASRDLAPSRAGLLLAVRGAWQAQVRGDASVRAVDHLAPGDGLWWDDESLGWHLTTSDPHAALIAVSISAANGRAR
jgi:environmental stress-induced protein Ves